MTLKSELRAVVEKHRVKPHAIGFNWDDGNEDTIDDILASIDALADEPVSTTNLPPDAMSGLKHAEGQGVQETVPVLTAPYTFASRMVPVLVTKGAPAGCTAQAIEQMGKFTTYEINEPVNEKRQPQAIAIGQEVMVRGKVYFVYDNGDCYVTFGNRVNQRFKVAAEAVHPVEKVDKSDLLCSICGKHETEPAHSRYGKDLDNPLKHFFEPHKEGKTQG